MEQENDKSVEDTEPTLVEKVSEQPMYYRGAAAAIVVYDITRKVGIPRSCVLGESGVGQLNILIRWLLFQVEL